MLPRIFGIRITDRCVYSGNASEETEMIYERLGTHVQDKHSHNGDAH